MKRSVLFSLLCILSSALVHGQEAHFQKRDTQVNDTSRQVISCSLAAERTIRQQQRLVDSSRQTLQRMQDRTLTILRVDQGVPSQATLTYGTSSTRVEGKDNQVVESIQPIAGNTYIITRRGTELSITDELGKSVTGEEEKLLRQHMETFGKPNPLAQFLNGKRIAVGQSIDVPDVVARELLGLTGNSGKTDKLSLHLKAVEKVEQRECATFETLLRTHGQETSMSLLMKGELVIETRSCRTRSIRLQGPVAISEIRGPTEGRFVVSTSGTLKVAVQTSFEQPTASVADQPVRRR